MTHMRVGLPFRSSLSDVVNFHRWATSWVFIAMDRNAVATAQQRLRMFNRGGSQSTLRKTKVIDAKDRNYLRKEFGRRMTDDAVEVEEHPFLDAIENPNPILDGFSLMWLTASHLQLTGAAFWHMVNKPGSASEIWPLPAQFVRPIIGKTQVFDHYELRIGGKQVIFPAKEIVHFRKPSIVDTLGAFGPLRGILESAETNVRMLEYERALFENFAVPDVLLSAKGDTTADQMRQLKHDFINEAVGWRKAGVPYAVPAEVEVQRLGFSNRDLQFEQGKPWIRDEILAGFGVPLPVVKADGTPFNNIQQGIALWKRQTIAPMLTLIAETLNCRVMPQYTPTPGTLTETQNRPTWFVAFDDPTPEDENELVTRNTARLASGETIINEVRSDAGQDPVPWGWEPWMPAGLQQPSAAAEVAAETRAQTERTVAASERLTDSRTSEAGAEPAVTPPTFAELATMYQQTTAIGDIELTNVLREELAARLGADVSDIKELLAGRTAQTGIGAIANPDKQPEPPEGETDANATNGGGSAAPPKEKEDEQAPARKPSKPKGKAAAPGDRDEGGEAGGVTALYSSDHDKRWQDVYAKIDRDQMDPEKQDRTLLAVVRQLFADMETNVDQNVAPLFKLAERLAAEGKEMTAGEMIRMLYDSEEWAERFVEKAEPILLPLVRLGSQQGVIELGAHGVPAVLLGPNELKTATREFSELVGNSVIGSLSEEFAEKVLPLLQPNEDGKIDTIAEIAKRVNEVFEGADKVRSERIARTEVNNALNAGAAKTFVDAGVAEHEWLASADACQFCLAMDGKRVKVGAAFVKMGSTVTGVDGGTLKVNFRDITHPTLHPNCRCTIIPIV